MHSRYLSTVFVLGLFIVTGYIFMLNGSACGLHPFQKVLLISSASINTALLFILFGLMALNAQADKALDSSLVKKFLPGILFSVFSIGWLVFTGRNIAPSLDFWGDSVAICVIILVTAALLFRVAKSLFEQEEMKRKSEKALLESENRFSSTFHQAAVGIAHIALNGSFIRVNQEFCNIVGYTQYELLALMFQDITFMDDQESHLSDMLQLLSGKISTYSLEKRYIRKDGSLVWVSVTASLVRNIQGEPDYFISVIKDISKNKKAEEQILQLNKELEERVLQRTEELIEINQDLQDTVKKFEQTTLELQHQNMIFENALEGIAKWDNKGHIVSANAAYAKMMGYDLEELPELHWESTVPADEIERITEAYYESIKNNKKMELEIKSLRKDGSAFYSDIVLICSRNTEGEIDGYYCFSKDITERMCLEAEKEQERKIFVSTLTHDLRTPLIAQRRVLDLFKEEFEVLDEEKICLTNALIRNNENLLVMVNHLLESYQYEDGNIKLKYESVDLHQLAAECIAGVSALATAHSVQILNNIPQNLAVLPIDRQQIKRVFQNLLGNALENMPPGDRIELDAKENENSLEIRVIDNGPGIDPDIRPFLFERYFMGSKKQKIGSGLGLFICKLILQQHGGAIDVQSDPATGTIFVLTLPHNAKGPSNG